MTRTALACLGAFTLIALVSSLAGAFDGSVCHKAADCGDPSIWSCVADSSNSTSGRCRRIRVLP